MYIPLMFDTYTILVNLRILLVSSCGFHGSTYISLFADERPNLLKLLNFPGRNGNINIPQQVGTKYFTFGVLLLNDKTGAEMSAIVTKYRDDAEQINSEILRLWIGGKGKSLSWDTLINVLKAITLNALAGDIQDSLQH